MNTIDNILNELIREYPALATINRTTVYTIPSGYFEALEDNIFRIVNFQSNSTSFSHLSPLAVPEQYFEGLASIIVGRIKELEAGLVTETEEELNNVAPFLNHISKKQLFTVPPGYFEGINSVDPLDKQKGSKVIVLSKFRKVAVAAIITGIVAIGGGIFLNHDFLQSNNFADTYNSSTVQKDTFSYPDFNISDISSLSEEDISEFLSTHITITDVTATNFLPRTDPDLQSTVKEMPDKDIKQYLQENPEPKGRNRTDG